MIKRGDWSGGENTFFDDDPLDYMTCWDVGCVYLNPHAPGYRIRKWGTGIDPLDPEVYDTLEAAKLAVEIKYG